MPSLQHRLQPSNAAGIDRAGSKWHFPERRRQVRAGTLPLSIVIAIEYI